MEAPKKPWYKFKIPFPKWLWQQLVAKFNRPTTLGGSFGFKTPRFPLRRMATPGQVAALQFETEIPTTILRLFPFPGNNPVIMMHFFSINFHD
jgi:hypothetical protein